MTDMDADKQEATAPTTTNDQQLVSHSPPTDGTDNGTVVETTAATATDETGKYENVW